MKQKNLNNVPAPPVLESLIVGTCTYVNAVELALEQKEISSFRCDRADLNSILLIILLYGFAPFFTFPSQRVIRAKTTITWKQYKHSE
jgi:hypothetical protein